MVYSQLIILVLGVSLFFGVNSAFADALDKPHNIETVMESGLDEDCFTDECYTPSTLTVDVGQVITMIKNDKSSIHTFTSGTTDYPDSTALTKSGTFDSGDLFPGDCFEYIADTVGEFPYFCKLHLWTMGVLIVQGEAGITPTVNPPQAGITPTVNPPQAAIPDWIRNVASFWCEDKIDDASFIEGIQYLIDNNIIIVSATSGNGSSQEIPNWVKNNACWWSEGIITSEDFASGIEFLVSEGIIRV